MTPPILPARLLLQARPLESKEIAMRPVSLVVMEKGSQWPGHTGEAEDLVAVGADSEGLRESVRLRLQSLRRAGRQVRVAALACNDAIDAASNARRTDVARELLRAVASGSAGRVVLSSPEFSSPALRGHLLDMVASLCEELAGTDATLTVRFERAPSEPTGGAPPAHLRLVSDRRVDALPATSSTCPAHLGMHRQNAVRR